MLVIGLVGEIASGKSTFCNHVREKFGVKSISIRDCYYAPGESLDRRTVTQGLEDEVQRFHKEAESPSRTRHARDYVGQRVGQRLANLKSEVVVLSDIVRIVEVNYLKDYYGPDAVFLLLEIGPLEFGVRWDRHVKNLSAPEQEYLSEIDFKACDEFESGFENTESTDWWADIRAVSRIADQRLSNDGTLEEYYEAIDKLFVGLGVAADFSDEASSTDEVIPVVRDQTHDPNSTPRVRELQRRYFAARFLNSFYSLKPPALGRLHDHASESERIDELAIVEIMRQKLGSLGIQPESEENERLRALSPLIGPRHVTSEINNQTMHRLVKAFLVEKANEALAAFRAIPMSTSLEEILVGCLNDTSFIQCHRSLHEFLDQSADKIHNYATSSFRTSRQTCDARQMNGASSNRGLKIMREEGIRLLLTPEGLEEVRQANYLAGEGPIPIIELVKNKRILECVDLRNSKVSLAIHDAVDHVWFFDLLRKSGLLDRHKVLFDDLGAPQACDIFQRSAECVASISFGVRMFATSLPGFVPLHTVDEIKRDFETAIVKEGHLQEHHVHAYETIRSLSTSPMKLESQSLAFVWSNYLVELNEQRRKDGEILRRVNSAKWEPLDPRSLDYLAFFIDAHSALHVPSNKHRDNLLRVHLTVESFLRSAAEGGTKETWLKWSDLTSRSHDAWKEMDLPSSRIVWMVKHHGFTAIRDSVI